MTDETPLHPKAFARKANEALASTLEANDFEDGDYLDTEDIAHRISEIWDNVMSATPPKYNLPGYTQQKATEFATRVSDGMIALHDGNLEFFEAIAILEEKSLAIASFHGEDSKEFAASQAKTAAFEKENGPLILAFEHFRLFAPLRALGATFPELDEIVNELCNEAESQFEEFKQGLPPLTNQHTEFTKTWKELTMPKETISAQYSVAEETCSPPQITNDNRAPAR